MENVIVTGCDEQFFGLAQSLLSSLFDLNLTDQFKFVFLDVGISTSQKHWLVDRHIEVVSLNFLNDAQQQKFKNRRNLLINYHKAHLNKLLSGYQTIIFLDADTWMQTTTAINYLLQGAAKNKLAIVSQASRLQNSHLSLRFHPFSKHINRVEPRGILYKNALRARLPLNLTKSLVSRPVLNCGVYALNVKAPHWKYWQYWQDLCLKKGRVFTSDQLSLALAVDQNKLGVELLPDICNFLDPPVWRYDSKQRYFTDLYIPYEPISIIHLAGMHNKLDPNMTVPCIDQFDQQHMRKIHYHHSVREKELEAII